MITLHDNQTSGNAYKVRLLLSQLEMPFQRIEYDTSYGKSETRTADYLAKNPNGRVPMVELEDGRVLPESGAILFHLAEGTPFLSDDAWTRAQTLQWMFFEQYSHEPFVAVAISRLKYLGERDGLEELQAKGYQAFEVMETHLSQNDFFAGNAYSIADIALYAYSHIASYAEFDLAPYGAVRRWLDRVADQPGHVLITQSGN